ncbi:MAG TPA: hypothetical protein PKE39_14220 [Ignavibacteria bacterium]|nr:hypothetical protein [Ignavibacteria bacterium]HMR00174.1 hypothetical protein [Ignavibacteria bacterium]
MTDHLSTEKKLHFTFRIAIAMCFIGHGAFGIITKQIWCNYFGVFGIGQEMAYKLMPVVGTFDIIMGTTMLVYPMRIVPAWLVFWGVFTALLRPLSHEPFAEFIERAGNYGVPLAMLFLYGVSNDLKGWFTKMKPDITTDEKTINRAAICLRLTVFLLLAGHGWLNVIQKQGLLNQYASIGISNPASAAQFIGIFEIIAAFAILIKPIRQLLIPILVWKMFSELFYPAFGYWEWIERGGSYAAILGLWFISSKIQLSNLFSLFSISTSSLSKIEK